MKTIAKQTSRVFLGDHPPITQRVLLTSTGSDEVLLAGSVIGVSEAKPAAEGSEATPAACGLFAAGMTPVGILQADVELPAEGDAWGVVYVHCSAVASGLIWGDGVSADQQAAAIAALRGLGVFVE